MMGMYYCCSPSRALILSKDFALQTVFARIVVRGGLCSLRMNRRNTDL